ncbi:MAG: hypothetical protein ACE5IM_07175 [Nitrospinota bacterium]
MNALKAAHGWIGIGFATMVGIGALIVAGVLALAHRLRLYSAAALSWAVMQVKSAR